MCCALPDQHQMTVQMTELQMTELQMMHYRRQPLMQGDMHQRLRQQTYGTGGMDCQGSHWALQTYLNAVTALPPNHATHMRRFLICLSGKAPSCHILAVLRHPLKDEALYPICKICMCDQSHVLP